MCNSLQKHIIYEKHTGIMKIQVYENAERRELRFGNNVIQSAMSLVNPEFLLLQYTRYMLLGLVLHPQATSILHIGMGAGSVPRFIHKAFPHIHQEIVEQTAEVADTAYQFFDFPKDDRIQIQIGEGEQWVQQCQQRYDLIMLDAFGAHGTPYNMTTVSFLKQLQQCLCSDGWIVGNVWTADVPLAQQILCWQQAFREVIYAKTQSIGNVIFFGSNTEHRISLRVILQQAQDLQSRVPLEVYKMSKQLVRANLI